MQTYQVISPFSCLTFSTLNTSLFFGWNEIETRLSQPYASHPFPLTLNNTPSETTS